MLSFFISVSGAVFARIVPDRHQFFEYDNVSVHCEEDNSINEWTVKWKSHKIANASLTLNISASPCTISPMFERHSGEYWCENEKGERSEVVNISVTGMLGDYILYLYVNTNLSLKYPLIRGQSRWIWSTLFILNNALILNIIC